MPSVHKLKKIKTFLEILQRYALTKAPNTFLEKEKEDIDTIQDLINIVNHEITHFRENKVSEHFASELKKYFAARFKVVANSSICYTQNITYPLNVICAMLADYVNPEKKVSLLLPGVQEQDVLGNDINQMSFGEFILDDNKTRIMCMEDLVSSACSRILNDEKQLYAAFDEHGKEILLSPTELGRCGKIIPVLNSIRQMNKSNPGGFLEILGKLRDDLLRGDVSHGGQELDAGHDANVGIAHFYAIYCAMPENQKQRLRAFSEGTYNVGHILDRLFRPQDSSFESVRFCIEGLGRILESIIDENAVELSGITLDIRTMLNAVKIMLSGNELSNDPGPLRQGSTRRASLLDPSLTFNENEFVISFIAPKSSVYIPKMSRIVVEGLINNKLFVGSYFIEATMGKTGRFMPDCFQNTSGFINKVNAFEFKGYAQIPMLNEQGQFILDHSDAPRLKFDQVAELKNSLSRSHQVPVQNVLDMIESINEDALKTNIATWAIGDISQLSEEQVEALKTDVGRSGLFIPFERFGDRAFFGNNKHNCVTWCEAKLAVAGCGKNSPADIVKAKPLFHVG